MPLVPFKADRWFGLVIVLVALAFMVSATGLETSFMSDPVGSKTFPMIVGGIVLISALVMIVRPDQEPSWPHTAQWRSMVGALLVLIAYALLLKPLGFLLPTAVAAGIISYLEARKTIFACLAGVGLSAGLLVLFKYGLGLGLRALPF